MKEGDKAMADKTFAGLSYDAALQKYADTVAGVCVMRLQNWADAEDCFQNTFIKLFQKSPDFQSETHLKAWLIRVAINECRNYIAKNRRFLSLEHLEREPATREPTVWRENESDVSWALMRLEPKYREVLYLHYCEQYKVNEIADILGKSPNTVKTLLRRGRDKLKKMYGGDMDESSEL
ncbi:MAG: sigma-70 family RNA polymerase sigma factor [Ruminococcus sp.]|nr:sigma-70 family RNA polymerase sigma factor [Ruminococcus sp.]